MGKRLFPQDFDLLPDLPVPPEVVPVEGAQGTDGLVDGAALEVALRLQMNQEVQDLGLAETWKLGVGIVVGELDDPADVVLL